MSTEPIPAPSEADGFDLMECAWGSEAETVADHLYARFGPTLGDAYFDRLYARFGGGRAMLCAYVNGDPTDDDDDD